MGIPTNCHPASLEEEPLSYQPHCMPVLRKGERSQHHGSVSAYTLSFSGDHPQPGGYTHTDMLISRLQGDGGEDGRHEGRKCRTESGAHLPELYKGRHIFKLGTCDPIG